MADRLPIVSIAGEKKELPASDTIAQSKINSLVGDLALKAPLASPVFTGISDFSAGGAYFGTAAAANLLDDYEEGTWTPSLGGTATYTNRAGHYTKIGDMCHVAFDMVVATIGTGDIFTVAGLPFTASSAIGFAGACSAGSVGFFSGLATSVSGFVVSIDSGYTNCAIRSMVGNVASAQNNAIFGDGARIVGSAVYKVA
jgi:hypothetical protein